MACRDCGETFEALNLGRLTATICPKCGKAQEERQQASEKLAQEQAEEKRYRELIHLANVPPRWREVTFDTLDPNIQPVAQRLARKYAEGFNKESPSLVLYSPGNGTGKTTLAACIVNYVLHELRCPVMFAKARDIMLEIRRTFSDRYETEAEILEKVSYVDLLLLDDVGVDRPSEWLKSTYWTLMDRRFDWMLPVVVTTNKPFEGRGEILADRIGAGAASRLLGLCQGNVIDMTGPDLR
ncbi:MAG: ATP-binding protein [Bacteroidales bacterium]|nr:ATP-binding protein [Bacteroidales bacterium]